MPHFMSGAVSILDHSQLSRELRLLERRTSPSGKDSIDHGKNGLDDYANSLCGCIAITLKKPREVIAERRHQNGHADQRSRPAEIAPSRASC